NIPVYSNDPLHPADSVFCRLHINSDPCATFSYDRSLCSPVVLFHGDSINNPLSYAWDFGDGGTAATRSPSHTFPSNAVYPVKLIVCNATGCDSLIQYVSISGITGPVAAQGTPATSRNGGGVGISFVSLNHISNNSLDGSAGYEDFTCSDTTSMLRGTSYAFQVNTGASYQENVKAWIDYNNDGDFADAGEDVFTSYTAFTHSGFINVPSTGVVWNTPLRL